ncbi:cytochrome c oxidase subunit 3 [Rhizobiaceae bacterium n13]|uniref:Cytochrome c oxidase subunit 3 n=1 Tax=Ferirhizobium litorale TaxID=2927786 RepID=A0AAE3QBR5_9HYPH|nr:cytochrome c oxidase subunit 3 [Fererhizobium litorale]MDI7861727.1 cytochrome c oxidase subunit 3 [Fererhizobium litorale]MDI7921931.1 cytochrome c oxidase subunit 3 [Fererhizobium litorale]
MTPILVFMGILAAIMIWWLARHRIASKPWMEVGLTSAGIDRGGAAPPTAKIGMGVFLAVVGALFSLLTSAYFMRMNASDWWAMPVPWLLWVNTAVLAANSVAIQWAAVSARRGQHESVRIGLVGSFVLGGAFLAGQLLVWRQLVDTGYLLTTNPANSFFYLITGLHGLHIVGGLVGLVRTTAHAYDGSDARSLRLGVDLCAMYWHFMFFVWLVLLALFSGYASDFVEICRQLVT